MAPSVTHCGNISRVLAGLEPSSKGWLLRYMAKPLALVSGPPNVRTPAPLAQVASLARVCRSKPELVTATLISTKNDCPCVPFRIGRKTPDRSEERRVGKECR